MVSSQNKPHNILPKKVILFDFDQTLVNGHFHNALAKEDEEVVARNKAAGLKNGGEYSGTFHNLSFEAQKIKIDNLIQKYGIKNQKLLLDIMRVALAEGHQLGIVNFTAYPQGILPSLKALGLNEQELEHFKKPGHISAWLPLNQQLGKKEHILNCLKKMSENDGIEYEVEQVIFLDDLPNNIATAENDPELGGKGLICIQVPSEPNAAPDYLLRLIKEANLPLNT